MMVQILIISLGYQIRNPKSVFCGFREEERGKKETGDVIPTGTRLRIEELLD